MTDPQEIRALADRLTAEPAIPGPVEPLRRLGDGFFSRVYETANGMVVRAARTRDAAERHAAECRLLPWLARQLPVAVPAGASLLAPGEGLPFGGLAYPKLPGRVMAAADAAGPGGGAIARELGRVIAVLHSLPVEEARALGMRISAYASERGMSVEGLAAVRERVRPLLVERLTWDEVARVEAWWDALLADDAMQAFTPAVRHCDLWWENLLLDEGGRLTGIVDWEWLSIGDPATDLAVPLHMGRPFWRTLVEAYVESGGGFDEATARRVERWWEFQELEGLEFALDLDDEAEIADTIAKLRAGPVLAP